MLKEKKPELIEFGRKMLAMRKAKHMTQKELADALVIDYRVVSRYETGEAEMGVVLYQKMLGVFGVTSLAEQPGADSADLLQLWGNLTPENRLQLMSLAAMMNKSQMESTYTFSGSVHPGLPRTRNFPWTQVARMEREAQAAMSTGVCVFSATACA